MMWDKDVALGPGWPFMSLLMPLIAVVTLDLILRGMSLWKSAKAGQKGWFIALLVLNTLGILPIVYLLFFQPKGKKK